jgi:hypothetical protein
MRSPRFSIVGLLAIVAVIAVGIAALRYASQAWAAVFAVLTLALLFTSILGAVRGRDLPFWRGVALFGWGFLFLDAFTPWWIDESVRPRTTLSAFLTEVFPVVFHNPPLMGGAMGAFMPGTPPPRPQINLYSVEYKAFQNVGAWLSHLLFAIMGGIVGRIVLGGRSRPTSPANDR